MVRISSLVWFLFHVFWYLFFFFSGDFVGDFRGSGLAGVGADEACVGDADEGAEVRRDAGEGVRVRVLYSSSSDPGVPEDDRRISKLSTVSS